MFADLDDPAPPAIEDRLRAGVRTRVRARRRRRLAVGGAAGAVAIGVGGLSARAVQPLQRVETLDLELAERAPVVAGGPTTVLVLGTDSADGLEPVDGSAPATGERVDSVVVLRTDPASGVHRLMSFPRDLQVDTSGGTTTRLADLFTQEGVEGVIRVVEPAAGVAIDHVVVVDFAAFQGAVDAIGGIEVRAAVKLRDRNSGLSIEQPGCVRLDGAQALAFVRARHLEVFVDGAWEADPSGDLGRMQRQRALADIVRAQIGVPDPLTLHDLTEAVADDLGVDAGLDVETMVSILNDVLLGRLDSLALPTSTATAADGSVRLVPTADAAAVTQWFATGVSGEQAQTTPPSTMVTEESLLVPDSQVSGCD